MNKRKVIDIVQGYETQDGAGVSLTRVLGRNTAKAFDPFLLMDSFDSTNPDDYTASFPLHPHRGIETITYLVEGEVEHKDSLGNSGKLNSGDSQWMTAGSGIMHEEMFLPSPRMFGLQLWLNLPKDEKMTDPNYFDIRDKDMKVKDYNDYEVRVLAGEFQDLKGVKPPHIQATIYDIKIKNGKKIEIPTKENERVFIFTLLGECKIDDIKYGEKTAILFSQGNAIEVEGASDDLRIMFFSAPILNEDIAWGGPIVMNSREELSEAFKELDEGTFIKKSAK